MKNNIVYTRTNRDILEQSDGQKHPIGNKRHQMHVVVGVSGYDTVEFVDAVLSKWHAECN